MLEFRVARCFGANMKNEDEKEKEDVVDVDSDIFYISEEELESMKIAVDMQQALYDAQDEEDRKKSWYSIQYAIKTERRLQEEYRQELEKEEEEENE